MNDWEPTDQLIELIEGLQEGSLSEADFAELEKILAKDQKAREFYILQQELQTMLEADKSIRLQLAADLLPQNVIAFPGVDVSKVPIHAKEKTATKTKISGKPIVKSTKEGFRMAKSAVAMLCCLWVLMLIYKRVPEFTSAIAAKLNAKAEVAEQKISFHEMVLPILTNRCLDCHGENEETREGDLRLDVASSSCSGPKPAIVPGKPNQSELFARVSSHDPKYMMPPPDSKKCLSAEEIDILRKWIEQGADYEPKVALLKLEYQRLDK